VLSAGGLPGHKRARMAREISLGKDMVREVRQALTLEVWQIEADALGRSLGVPGVVTAYVFIVHPDGHGDIHCV
jgi:anti-sigma-K factor RskA